MITNIIFKCTKVILHVTNTIVGQIVDNLPLEIERIQKNKEIENLEPQTTKKYKYENLYTAARPLQQITPDQQIVQDEWDTMIWYGERDKKIR